MSRNANLDPHGRKLPENGPLLGSVQLKRRTGCDPVLRALALDRVTLGMRLHLVRCSSCRRAATALRENGDVDSLRRVGLLCLAVAAVAGVVAAPLAISRAGEHHLPAPHGALGGAAELVGAPTAAGDGRQGA